MTAPYMMKIVESGLYLYSYTGVEAPLNPFICIPSTDALLA